MVKVSFHILFLMAMYFRGYNCIHHFQFGEIIYRQISIYSRKFIVLRKCASLICNRFIGHLTSSNENFEYGYISNSDALLQLYLKLECCRPHKDTGHQRKCDIINDVKLFTTGHGRINCSKFLTLSNQISRYKSKCIRIIL